MQGIDQDAGIGLPHRRDDAGGCREIRDIGPGHEFEIGRQPVWRGGLAKSGIGVPEPAEVGIITRDQDVLGAEPRAGLEKSGEGGNLGFRPERDHFEVGHLDAGRIQPGEGFLQARCVVQRIGDAAGHRGQQPDSDGVIAASRGDVDQRRRREIEDGQRGERERRHYSKSAIRASSANMP